MWPEICQIRRQIPKWMQFLLPCSGCIVQFELRNVFNFTHIECQGGGETYAWRGVFEYHPDAKEKLRDLQYLGVQMAIFAYA